MGRASPVVKIPAGARIPSRYAELFDHAVFAPERILGLSGEPFVCSAMVPATPVEFNEEMVVPDYAGGCLFRSHYCFSKGQRFRTTPDFGAVASSHYTKALSVLVKCLRSILESFFIVELEVLLNYPSFCGDQAVIKPRSRLDNFSS